MSTTATIARAREAFALRAWGDVCALLQAADRESPLAADALELLAAAAHLAGQTSQSADAWTRAHQELLDRGDVEGAARSAFRHGFALLAVGEHARGGGWIAKAKRLLDEHGRDCVEQGYVLLPAGVRAIYGGDCSAALAVFERAAEIGRRHADRDLLALSRHGMGRALIRLGEVQQGVMLLDEVMVAVETDDVSPLFAGDIYCSVIEACFEIFDMRRAQEWTLALTRWCEGQSGLVAFNGQCLTRRAEIMQLRGEWAAAADAAQRACDAFLRGPDQPAVGAAYYQHGELLRLRGDFAGAEARFRDASRRGRTPQPGLALLRLAQGQVDAARTAIRGALDEARVRATRCRLLPAAVEILLAADDAAAARVAADELGEIAASVDAPWPRAAAAQASGAVLLTGGEARAAIEALRRSWTAWQELDAPYDAARVRVLIGLCCRELGDEESAEMEFDAARWAFQQLRAAPDLERVKSLSRQATPASAGSLTVRELAVLRLIAAGETNRAIGDTLGISEKTVARHVSNIFTKLGLSSRAAATAYAFKRGLS